MQYYQADEKQYRFFRRLGDAFVRVGLLNDTSGEKAAAHYQGSCLALPNQDMKKSVPRFLNRLLGLTLPEQRMAFGYFQATFDAVVAAAKSRGDYDRGIQSIGAPLTLAEKQVLHRDKASGAETCALSLSSDLGLSWQDAAKALQEAADLALERGEAPSPHNGFYVDRDISTWGGTNHPRICLVVQAAREQAGAVEKFRVRRPNNGWLRLELSIREVRRVHLVGDQTCRTRTNAFQGLSCRRVNTSSRLTAVLRMPGSVSSMVSWSWR
ncbi:hypothetical protein COO60DRAFT_1114982 [Scenedesmus sp. NREL 46B-D3]|nr:hypothetical protein COO60DRAFT_1114982 [Scenedesmus sp. NREL 46B-D3]